MIYGHVRCFPNEELSSESYRNVKTYDFSLSLTEQIDHKVISYFIKLRLTQSSFS
jgi:hypothetical protein